MPSEMPTMSSAETPPEEETFASPEKSSELEKMCKEKLFNYYKYWKRILEGGTTQTFESEEKKRIFVANEIVRFMDNVDVEFAFNGSVNFDLWVNRKQAVIIQNKIRDIAEKLGLGDLVLERRPRPETKQVKEDPDEEIPEWLEL